MESLTSENFYFTDSEQKRRVQAYFNAEILDSFKSHIDNWLKEQDFEASERRMKREQDAVDTLVALGYSVETQIKHIKKEPVKGNPKTLMARVATKVAQIEKAARQVNKR